jgi:serine/threonine-protein kinase
LSIFAGTGTSGTPTPGSATSSSLNTPNGLAVDDNNNLYIADAYNNAIEKIDTQGILTVVAGIPGSSGNPTPGIATNSNLQSPTGVTVDSNNNLYIASNDDLDSRYPSLIEKVTSNGILSIYAGTDSATIPITNFRNLFAVTIGGNYLYNTNYNQIFRLPLQ